MKPFIESEIERLEKAVNALKVIKERIITLEELPKSAPILTAKMGEEIMKCIDKYDETRVDILKEWVKSGGNQNVLNFLNKELIPD